VFNAETENNLLYYLLFSVYITSARYFTSWTLFEGEYSIKM